MNETPFSHEVSRLSLSVQTLGLVLIFTLSAAGQTQKNTAVVPEGRDEEIGEKDSRPPDTNIPMASLYFTILSARVSNASKARLDEVALRSQQDPRAIVVIDGHRDSPERVGISFIRAKNARDYLVSEKGVDAARITVRDAEDSCPDESGDPALSRRTTVWVLSRNERTEDIKVVCRSGVKPQFSSSVGPKPSAERPLLHRAVRQRAKRKS